MSVERSEIEVAAANARQWIEKHLRKQFGPCYTGACAWATARLLYELHGRDIDARAVLTKLRFGGNHFYVRTRHYVVDVTATQFNTKTGSVHYPEIIIMDRRKAKEHFWNDVMDIFDTVDDVMRHTVSTGWPNDQIPKRKKLEKPL